MTSEHISNDHESIVAHAYDHVVDDTKFIRLTTITTFIHSMIFLVYIMYAVYFVVVERNGGEMPVGNIFAFIWQLFGWPDVFWLFVVIAAILAIGYFLLPPIAEASMIYYLDNVERKGTVSLWRGFTKFFPMFEYHGIMTFFNPLTFFIFASRFRVLGLLWNPFVLTVLIMWALIVFFTAVFLPYTRFIIVLENLSPLQAIKKSMNLALENLRQSVKFAFVSYLLYLRAFINILIFLGIPGLIIYLATKLDISSQWAIKYIIYGTLAILGLVVAYINGIVEAFFVTIWYNIYKKMKE